MKLTNAQFDREMRKIESTPPHVSSDDSDAEVVALAGVPEAGGVGVRLRNRHSSSCVVSEGTFPTHMTQSERCAGGLGRC